jgi:hypothetical protein
LGATSYSLVGGVITFPRRQGDKSTDGELCRLPHAWIK